MNKDKGNIVSLGSAINVLPSPPKVFLFNIKSALILLEYYLIFSSGHHRNCHSEKIPERKDALKS